MSFEALDYDLSNKATFEIWERIYDRVNRGEMPPPAEAAPNESEKNLALESLALELNSSSLKRQLRVGRVPARRLTKLEYGYTIRDLILVDEDVSIYLPDESNSGSFDTVGESQRVSAVHMEGYLEAADRALERAIQLGRQRQREHVFDFESSPFLQDFHDKPLNLGGGVTKPLEDGIALFNDVDYLFQSQSHGFNVSAPGTYRIATTVKAIQTDEPIVFKLIRKGPGGDAALLTSVDLEPGKPMSVEVDAFLKPGDTFYPTFATDESRGAIYAALFASGGAKNYHGKGLLIQGQSVEGPLYESWPPISTKRLLQGVKLNSTGESNAGPFEIELPESPGEHISLILRRFAPLAFRRPVTDREIESLVSLAEPAFEEKRSFEDGLRLPLRSMLTSPSFLMFDEAPGELGDFALASRLSYFLWKSMPDEELFSLAEQGRLNDSEVLKDQVDRMLQDEKAQRFVKDFLGQWLHLYRVNATAPDEKLYPEFDELLGSAIPVEPELFFAELIRENLSVENLIDSDFTFVNRRLADHYEIEGVKGQNFRRIDLPEDSPRGGLLTQAAILKTTANGTFTSPVTRGNFVLTSLLGTPPSPPPPTVGSIEPDTRGKTTIREILAAHRNIDSCNQCHRSIDPPGFALECFNPIGGYRTHYQKGPEVDASGVTRDGTSFDGITEFKTLLLKEEEQVARHFIGQLIVYSTGGEIQFSDREEIESILARTRESNYPIRDIIHEVVQSRLFRNK